MFEWGGGSVQGTLESGSCCGLVIDESDGSQTMYVGRPAFSRLMCQLLSTGQLASVSALYIFTEV